MDPRLLCCAAEICCGRAEAIKAQRQILENIGVPEEAINVVIEAMHKNDIYFAPGNMIRAIAEWTERKQ